MYKNKIAVVTKFPEETLELIHNIIRQGGRMFDNSAYYEKHMSKRIINLELINNKFVIFPTEISFKTPGKYYNEKIKFLSNEYNLVDFKYIKSKDFTIDMNLYDQDWVNLKHKENFEDSIIYKLEVGQIKLIDIIDKNDTVWDYIIKNDANNILKFALNHYLVKNQILESNLLDFSKELNPKCYELINHTLKISSQEDEFNFDL